MRKKFQFSSLTNSFFAHFQRFIGESLGPEISNRPSGRGGWTLDFKKERIHMQGGGYKVTLVSAAHFDLWNFNIVDVWHAVARPTPPDAALFISPGRQGQRTPLWQAYRATLRQSFKGGPGSPAGPDPDPTVKYGLDGRRCTAPWNRMCDSWILRLIF